MPEIEKVIEQPHSCKISINAKGQYSGEVKVYAKTPFEAFTEASSQAAYLEGLIKLKNDTTKPGGA